MGNIRIITNTNWLRSCPYRLNKPHEVITVSKKLTTRLTCFVRVEMACMCLGGVSLQINNAAMDPLELLAIALVLKTYCHSLQNIHWAWLLSLLSCGGIVMGSFNQQYFLSEAYLSVVGEVSSGQTNTHHKHKSRQTPWDTTCNSSVYSTIYTKEICPKTIQNPQLEALAIYQDRHGPTH